MNKSLICGIIGFIVFGVTFNLVANMAGDNNLIKFFGYGAGIVLGLIGFSMSIKEMKQGQNPAQAAFGLVFGIGVGIFPICIFIITLVGFISMPF